MIPSFAYYIMTLRKEFIEFCNEKLQEIGLTQGQLFFLIYIGKHENCSPKELANRLHMDNGHATRSLTKLMEDGFISKTVHAKDKRAHVLSLTGKGKLAFQASHELFAEWDDNVLHDVSEKQRKEIIRFMEQLVHRKEDDSCNS